MFELLRTTISDFKNLLFGRIESIEKVSKNREVIRFKLESKFLLLESTIDEIESILIKYSWKLTKRKKRNLFNQLQFLPKEEGSCFIVHGHDIKFLDDVVDFISDTFGFTNPIVLKKTKKNLKTIIESFEEIISKVNYVFVLLSADDKTFKNEYRARQNVIFELGFFIGKFTRKSGKIIILKNGNIELPSDISGMNIIDVTSGLEVVKDEILREIY